MLSCLTWVSHPQQRGVHPRPVRAQDFLLRPTQQPCGLLSAGFSLPPPPAPPRPSPTALYQLGRLNCPRPQRRSCRSGKTHHVAVLVAVARRLCPILCGSKGRARRLVEMKLRWYSTRIPTELRQDTVASCLQNATQSIHSSSRGMIFWSRFLFFLCLFFFHSQAHSRLRVRFWLLL